jgi:hypothetical protein
MRRTLAILAVLVGTTCFGIAAGYVYLDQREIQVRYIQAMAGRPMSEAELAVIDANRERYIARALVVGPAGAGLLLAGFVTVLLELRWFRRGPDGARE